LRCQILDVVRDVSYLQEDGLHSTCRGPEEIRCFTGVYVRNGVICVDPFGDVPVAVGAVESSEIADQWNPHASGAGGLANSDAETRREQLDDPHGEVEGAKMVMTTLHRRWSIPQVTKIRVLRAKLILTDPWKVLHQYEEICVKWLISRNINLFAQVTCGDAIFVDAGKHETKYINREVSNLPPNGPANWLLWAVFS
jgi:hypothetical protein